jgi:autoinducer 2-degrading protein
MIVTCVYIHVLPEAVEKFIKATSENHTESVKEKGNLRFDLIQKADDNCSFMLYEAYETEEAAAAHKNTPHYNKWRETVQDFMAEPRTGVRYKIIEPADKSKW